MARTKASQMNRKFINADDSSGSSEESSDQDNDMVEMDEIVEKQQEMGAGEIVDKRKKRKSKKDKERKKGRGKGPKESGSSEESSDQEIDMVEMGEIVEKQQEMGAGEIVDKRKKRKSKKDKERKKGRGKGPKEAPSHEELLDRLERKRENDRLGAQRRKKEKQEEWDGMVALLEDLQAQLRTAKCLTPAIDQYYARHGLEGLDTEQARLAVLKWVGRDKAKGEKQKKLQVPPETERRVLTPSNNQSLCPPPSQVLSSLPSSSSSSKPHFPTLASARKPPLKSPCITPHTSKQLVSSSKQLVSSSKQLVSSSKLPVTPSFKTLPSTTSILFSGDEPKQTSLPPLQPASEGSSLNTISGSTEIIGDGSFMEF